MVFSAQWQEEPRLRPMGHRQQVEKASGATGGLRELSGPTRLGQVHPMLSGIVDRIMDWDFPDGDAARALRTKILPSTAPWLIAQYRAPTGTYHHFGTSGYRHRRYCHAATIVRTGVATLRPSGPLGMVTIRLKPEAAARLMGGAMQAFADEKIELGNLFKTGDLSLLEEMLMEAPDSAARFARIESVLLRNLRPRQPDSVECRAAQCLRRNPSLSVRRLAAQLDVSERHLSRSFRAMFGTSPKQFARIARIEKIVAMWKGGSAWADIAYACGFADQAHMINDFRTIVGEPPQQVFRATGADADYERNTRIGRPADPNFFEC
jgi:AraC-like DNA-binding protein